jgi:hypothetical protein
MSTPYCRALLVAENVICDQFTDKWSLIDIFSTAWADHFPILFPKVACYASVFDVGGPGVEVRFRILGPEQNILREQVFPPMELDAKEESEFGCIFPNVLLDKEGRYSVEFLIDGQLLQSARLDVKLVPHLSLS